MRITVRTLALISVGALALVGLSVPAASAATYSITGASPAAYNASSQGANSTWTITGNGGTGLLGCDTSAVSVTLKDSANKTVNASGGTVNSSTCVWSATVSAADAQSLADGSITATASKSCGLFGCTTASATFLKDTVAPSAPGLAALGTNFAINNTNAAGVTATGSAEANSLVTLKLGSLTQTANANSSGLWSMFFSASGLADGTYTASLTATDAAGNVSVATTHSIIKDTVAAAKTATTPATGSTVGAPAKVSFTYNKTLAGTSTIVLKNSGGTAVGCTVAAPSGGTVSCTPSPALTSGAYSATATVYDTHGNQTVTTISFTVDATAPAVTSLKATNTTATSQKSTVTGHVSEAATLTVTSSDSTGAKASASLKVTAATNFSLAVDETTLGGGTITVTVKAVDPYGNTSTTTTTHSRTLPAGTSISLSVPGWTAVGWPLTLKGAVHLAKPGPYGSVTLVHASLSGAQQILATVNVSSTGAYSFTYTPGTSGTYYAIYNATTGSGAQSPTYSSQLRYAISASTTTGPASTPAVIGGAVHNPPPGTYVLVYKRNADGSWTQIGKGYIDRTYHYRVSVVLPKGSTAIRVTIPASHGYFGNAANVTATRT